MELILKRTYNNTDKGYCIGHLFVNGKYLCDTLEDVSRGLNSKMTLKEILKRKIKGLTAIPVGVYGILMNVVSPKYSKKPLFKRLCGGKMPRLLNVPGYDGVLIHTGNSAKDTDGCVLVGYNKVKGGLVNSTEAFIKLYDILKKAYDNHEGIYLRVVENF